MIHRILVAAALLLAGAPVAGLWIAADNNRGDTFLTAMGYTFALSTVVISTLTVAAYPRRRGVQRARTQQMKRR